MKEETERKQRQGHERGRESSISVGGCCKMSGLEVEGLEDDGCNRGSEGKG